MTLLFSRLLEIIQLHVRAVSSNQLQWFMSYQVHRQKDTSDRNKTVVATAGSKDLYWQIGLGLCHCRQVTDNT